MKMIIVTEKIFREINSSAASSVYTLWKNEKFSLTGKKFREIVSLVTSFLVKTLFSRIFCQTNVRVNFQNFDTVVQ